MRVESRDGMTAGRQTLRFEFGPTSEPDIAHGKGTPGRAQLYIDGILVGNAELPHTTPSGDAARPPRLRAGASSA